MNCTSVFYTGVNFEDDSFGFSTGVFAWDGQPKYFNIRDFGKVGPSLLLAFDMTVGFGGFGHWLKMQLELFTLGCRRE